MRKYCINLFFSLIISSLFAARYDVTDYGADGRDRVDDYDAIEAALYSAGRAARDSETPSVVYVPAGTYYISYVLHIFPNTTLMLDDDATIISTMNEDGGMLRGVHMSIGDAVCPGDETCRHGGYSQSHDVIVTGGTWNRNSPANCNTYVFSFRHSQRIVIKNVSITGATNHMLNLSGSKDSEVSNAVFFDAVKYTGNDANFWGQFAKKDESRYKTLEAIHLDVIDSSGIGEPQAYPLDDTVCSNITVKNCSFSNVFSGIGTHHLHSMRSSDVEVSDCSFFNLASFAVYCHGIDNAVFKRSTVKGGHGAVNVAGSLCQISELDISDSTDNAVYILSGADVKVSKCNISGAAKDKAAIRIKGQSTAHVNDCVIESAKSMGISVDEKSILGASGNKIQNSGKHAVYVVGQSEAVCKNNMLSTTGECGFMIKGGSKANLVSNDISKAGTFAVRVSEKSNVNAKDNVVESTKSDGFFVDGESYVDLRKNTVKDSGERGVRIVGCSTKCIVYQNAITDTLAEGIYFNGCANGVIKKNTVKKASGHAIRVQGTAVKKASVEISSNVAATSRPDSYADIRLGDYCVSCKVSANKAGNQKYSESKIGTSKNSYSPVSTSLASAILNSDGSKLIFKWSRQATVDGYQLEYATVSSFKKSTKVSVSKSTTTSVTVKNPSKEKKCYVRIRTWASILGVRRYSSWSAVMTVVPLSYTVQFNGNGATSGKTAAMKLSYGQAKALTANGFKKSGHSFKGWATSAANAKKGAVKYKNKAKVKSLSSINNKKITLYAVWSVNSYALTVKPNSTKYGSASKSGKYKYASKVKLTAKPKKGYYFYGWYKSDKKTLLSKSASYTYKMGGSTTVYAWFKKNAVKLGTALKDSYKPGSKILTTVGPVSGKAKSIKVSGLPPGLAYKSGKISGTASCPGVYTIKVTIVAADGAKLAYSKAITVSAPKMLVGHYTGMIGYYDANIVDDDPWMAYGMAKVTIASSGKITAKMTLPCGTYSFSAANWSSVKAGKYSAVLKAKSGEEFKLVIDSKRDWRDVAGESALKIKGYDRFDVPLWRNEHGKGGYIESDSYARNLISDIKAMKKLFFKVSGSKKKGYAVREVGVNDKNANLTVSFDSNGNVTYLGTVDGVRVSGSTFLCVDDDCYYTICDLVISVGEKESMYIPFGIEREWNGDISLEMEVYRVDFK